MDVMLAFSSLLSLLMLAVFFYDLTRYIIPNWLNALVVLFYPGFVLLSPVPVDWPHALAALGLAFAGGLALFAFRLMGAGDIKLFCGLALWCGFTKSLPTLMIYTGLLGGVLAVGAFLLRITLPAVLAKTSREIPIPRLLTHGEPIPYGLAISVAFLILLWGGEVPGLESIARVPR